VLSVQIVKDKDKYLSIAAEKANDRIVAIRQKHNGRSWSFEVSEALAVLTTVRKNNTRDSYLHSPCH
jgi:hypothetical protein